MKSDDRKGLISKSGNLSTLIGHRWYSHICLMSTSEMAFNRNCYDHSTFWFIHSGAALREILCVRMWSGEIAIRWVFVLQNLNGFRSRVQQDLRSRVPGPNYFEFQIEFLKNKPEAESWNKCCHKRCPYSWTVDTSTGVDLLLLVMSNGASICLGWQSDALEIMSEVLPTARSK